MNKRGKILILFLAVFFLLTAAQEAAASIVLKAVVVNPSSVRTQEATLKAYLPKEAQSEDVIDAGDLELDYDIEKGMYYVHKKFVLGPGESKTRAVEIRDVWVFSRDELESLSGDAMAMLKKLDKTSYFETAVALQKEIMEKKDEILRKQEEALDARPQTHIAVYRENKEKLNSIEEMLSKLQTMVTHVELSKKTGTDKGKVSVKYSWWVIIAVISFLGLISFMLFVVWQKKAAEKEEEKKNK